jgi:hypothetical protein
MIPAFVLWRTPAGEDVAHALIYGGHGRTYCGLTLRQVLNVSTFDDRICQDCREALAGRKVAS